MEATTIFIDCPFCTNGARIETSCQRCHSTGFLPWGVLAVPGDNIVYAHEIYDATDQTDYDNLSDGDEEAYAAILAMGILDLSGGTRTRTKLWDMFDGESTTRANLIALLA